MVNMKQREMKIQMEKQEHFRKKEVVVNLQGGQELKFLVAEDIEELITDISDEDKVPCWADIWPAAYGLAYYLWDNPEITTGKQVIELGAGIGLPGIVCAQKGVRVTLSDFNPTAMDLAGENARLNGVEVELLQEDWRSFQCRKLFDYILASDIIFDPKLNPFLGQIFYRNLKPGGRILIAHPDRKVTREFVEDCNRYNLWEREREIWTVELSDTLLPRYDIVINSLEAGLDADPPFSV